MLTQSAYHAGAFATSVVLGLSVTYFAWGLFRMMMRDFRSHAESHEFEEVRRIKLRNSSSMYRRFEPLIDELVRLPTGLTPHQEEELQNFIDQSSPPEPWRASEYIAVRRLEGILCILGGMAFGYFLGGWLAGLLLGPAVGFGYISLMTRKVGDDFRRRRAQIKSRLPFAVDLLAFMMEAGAGFHEALNTVVSNNLGHPLGSELGRVQQEIALGRSRQEALANFQSRLADDDVRELVFAVNKGEEMGTPLSAILRSQADYMRMKRSQWLEKAAQEAQVSIVFPGMLIMVACLLIVVAPFIVGGSF
jgi:tight adherence protein C